MTSKKILVVLLAILIPALSVPVSSAPGSSAYDLLAAQTPVYVEQTTLQQLEQYYLVAGTDEILDPAQCNYIYGEVSVGGVTELCHVYMRTFSITDTQNITIYDLEALAKRIVGSVKASAAGKYLKCIAKTYNARISSFVRDKDGSISSITVKIFIACGEKTEDRQQLKNGYIAEIADKLMPLDDAQRFIRMNELMLDGRFKYDMSYRHKCSAVALVETGMGVCEEYAGFTSLLLDALGYENTVITGEVGGIPHMWNLVTVGDRLYHLDILHDGPVNENGAHTSVTRKCLLVSTDMVSVTHKVAPDYSEKAAAAIYDYVFDGYPLSLRDAFEYNGNTYIHFDAAPTVDGLSEKLGAEGFIRVLKNGEELPGQYKAGTGCSVQLYVNGAVLEEHTLCVMCDADGDGEITDYDLSVICEYIMSTDKSRYTDAFILSADTDGDGTVSVTDAVVAFDVSAGRYVPKTDDQPSEPEEQEETP